MIDERALVRTRERVDRALAGGCELVAQGTVSNAGGYFYPATLLRDSGTGGIDAGVEWFAPVAVVTSFDTDDELITAATRSDAGLASYVFSQDLARARRVASSLEVGMTAVNSGLLSNAAAPFGGVKLSGHGREGGREGIEDYLRLHYVLEGDAD